MSHRHLVGTFAMTLTQTESALDDKPMAQKPTETNGNIQSIKILLISVAFGAVGQLTLKAGMNSVRGDAETPLQLSTDTLLRMATNPLLLLGIAIFGIGTLLWLLALSRADLSFAYPFVSLIYMAVLIGGVFLFHERIIIARIFGFAVIVTGVWIVARSEQKKKT
jgi:drug/metabolite transporter (DMT)-like permease